IERKNQRTWYSKPGERGITCRGRQKIKGKSISLI
ncbi:antitermination protein, partial [Escherichia coli]